MGGEAGVTSTPGAGATFWFTVLLRRAQGTGAADGDLAATVDTRQGMRHAGSAELPWDEAPVLATAAVEAPSILVVEDNAANRAVVLEQLGRLGFTAALAENGEEAAARLCRDGHGFALVLMDCQMPVLDGYSATARVRAWEAVNGGHVPIVALTAQALKGDAERSLAAGMDGHITKPVRLPKLRAVVAQYMGG
jgi:CheY-like chemotaxis protein